MVPTIVSVGLDKTTLSGTETNLYITATITDETGITAVYALLFDPGLGLTYAETLLSLSSGTNLDGLYSGTMDIPLDVPNGTYIIGILAANASTVLDDYDTFGINQDTLLSIERSVSGPGEPSGPVEPGESDTKDNGCCKVTININAGPVNIYVCDSYKKAEILP